MRELRRIVSYLRPYRAQALLSLAALALVVVLDLAIPRLIQRIIDVGIARRDEGVVLHTALAMLGLSALSAALAVANNALSVRAGEGVARDLREAVFLQVQRYSFGNLDRHKTGELLVRLTSDVSAVKMLTQVSLRIGTRAPLLMVGSLGLMVATSPGLALAMLPLLILTALLLAGFVARMEPMFRRVQQRLDALNTVLQENIAGARLVKALVRGAHEGQRFEEANEAMTARSVEAMQSLSLMTPLLTLCVQAGVVVVVWRGGARAIDGELSLGQIVAFSNYLLTTMTPLLMMSMLANTWAAGLASMRRIEEVLDDAPKVTDAPDAAPLPDDAPSTVGLEGATFSYSAGDCEPAVRDVTLAARPGETVAILGATGSGKSTLVSLIPRLYDVTAGRVAVGGRDVRAVTRSSLAGRVALVPQESVLFTGTIRDNIRYGRPDASDAEVERAARAAQAHDFIAKMPDGYDSPVAQRGANLSGGQRQRVAIARALLVQPGVLILDDSTSAVDVETETKIQRALAEASAGRSTIVVAQRISTVLDADVIVVLDRGRVVATGTHRALMASSPVYREIYDSQLGDGPSADGEVSP